MSYFDYPDYVSVAERRLEAQRKVAALKRKGQVVTPVVITGRKIAETFWGKAWCENLERYCDYESRLPRGRTYVRNGSVIDLQIARGQARAMVSGSSIYNVKIQIAALEPQSWRAIRRDCAGSVGSLVELLSGKLSKNVMERVCRQGDGLFPAPAEITISCSCPDWAGLCKHAAAALYGVGARLDSAPDLLFKLRGVDQNALIAAASADLPMRQASGKKRVLADNDVAALFGVEMAIEPAADSIIAKTKGATVLKAPKSKVPSQSKRLAKTGKQSPARPTGSAEKTALPLASKRAKAPTVKSAADVAPKKREAAKAAKNSAKKPDAGARPVKTKSSKSAGKVGETQAKTAQISAPKIAHAPSKDAQRRRRAPTRAAKWIKARPGRI